MAIPRTARLAALPAELRQSLLFQSRQHSTASASPVSPPPHSSVNPTETSHFGALASSWWDSQGPSRILHLMNPHRHEFIKRCRLSVPSSTPSSQKLRYMDIGCGGGIFAESAARLAHTSSVTAVDPTTMVIDVARAHQRRDPLLMQPGRLTYLNKAIEHIPVPKTPEEGVDVLTLFEVIEHIQSPAPFLEQCLKHVKPGGWFILSTISRTWTSWFTTIKMAEDVMNVVPPGTHDWNQYINSEEMLAWGRKQQGWGDIRTMGVVYVPGVGWREVNGSESWGNYFFGIRKAE